jgi:hypothetical protein
VFGSGCDGRRISVPHSFVSPCTVEREKGSNELNYLAAAFGSMGAPGYCGGGAGLSPKPNFQGDEKVNKLRTKKYLWAGLGILMLLIGANADELNQRTVFTFDNPVEVPGQILPSGTYVFKLASINSNREVVQVFNQDETRLFGTLFAVRDYRARASDKTIMDFEERAGGAPQALKAWFYPGRAYGHQFVYDQSKLAIARAETPPTATFPTALAVANVTMPRAHADLWSAGLSLPFVGLIGLLSMGTAVTMALAAARAKARRVSRRVTEDWFYPGGPASKNAPTSAPFWGRASTPPEPVKATICPEVVARDQD